MAKTSFAWELVGNIGQGEVPVNFIDVFVVFVGDEVPPLGEEGARSFPVVGEASHGAATHHVALGANVGEGLDGFRFGAKNLDIGQAQFFAEMLEMSRSQTARLHPDEFPMGECNGQGKQGESRARTEVQPLAGFLQMKLLGSKEGRKRILDMAREESGQIFLADQVLGLACSAGQGAQLLQGGMRCGWDRRLGMFHVEPRLGAKLAQVCSKCCSKQR